MADDPTCTTMIKLKRIYEPAARGDGFRLLVDRIWPRGVSKKGAQIDEWLPDVAPSHELRRWYAHDPERWKQFCRKYFAELHDKPEIVSRLHAMSKRKTLTLLFASRETKLNNAAALRRYIDTLPGRLRGGAVRDHA